MEKMNRAKESDDHEIQRKLVEGIRSGFGQLLGDLFNQPIVVTHMLGGDGDVPCFGVAQEGSARASLSKCWS